MLKFRDFMNEMFVDGGCSSAMLVVIVERRNLVVDGQVLHPRTFIFELPEPLSLSPLSLVPKDCVSDNAIDGVLEKFAALNYLNDVDAAIEEHFID